MKTKLLFLSLLMLGMGASLPAQLTPAGSSTGSITTNAANCNTTNACIVLHLASSNVGYSVTASGTWTGTLTVEQSGDNQGSWTSATTTTANTLFTSPLTPGITDVRVRGSAAMTGAAVITITASGPATLQQITQTNTSSSSSTSKNAIDGNSSTYGLFWDTSLVNDGAWSSGVNPTVTSTNATFTSADVGKTFKGTGSGTACGENQATSSATTLTGTIASVTDSHHIVVTGTASGSVTSACFAYGHIDDTGLTAMETAGKALTFGCPKYILPAGLGMMNLQHFNDKTAYGTVCQTIAQQGTGYSGPDVGGSSTGTTGLVLGPTFVPANCTGGSSSNRCMGGMFGATYHDFFVHGICDMRAGQTDNVIWFGTGYSDSVDRVNLRCYGVNDTGFGALNTDFLGGKIPNLIVDGFGRGVTLSSSTLNSTYGAITVADLQGGSFVTVNGTGFLNIQELIIYFGQGASTNSKAVTINNGATLQVQNMQVTENLGTNAVQAISNSGTVYLLGGQIDASGNTAGQAFQNLSGGKAYIANTSFKGGATGQDIFNLTGATLTDFGGNLPVQGRVISQTGSLWNGPAVFKGSCSGVGTAASTLGLYGLGENTTPACTSTTVNLGKVATVAGTAYDLVVSATAAGTNASSGVVTVLKNGSAQNITCTIGTGTSCADTTHTFTFVAGDVISVQFTTQAADTLAGVTATVVTM